MTDNWSPERAKDIISAHLSLEGPLLPILHALQQEFGYLPREALVLVAEALNITRADVHGVASFYPDFRSQPPGRHVLKICRAEACQAMGGEENAEALLARLGLSWGTTSANGALTIEPVYCLGLCATAPNAQRDGEAFSRLDADTLEALAREVL
jgi:formate dehydrogenase subunit gamma